MIDSIRLGRDRTGAFDDRDPGQFLVSVATSDNVYANEVFKQYNIIQEKNHRTHVEYRMASKNPRNKINKADSLEAALIDLFNKDSSITKYTGIVTLHGEKHLYYARPFLRVEKNCLKCHGEREDAPKSLSDYYKWDSGFNLTVITSYSIHYTKLYDTGVCGNGWHGHDWSDDEADESCWSAGSRTEVHS